VSSVGVEKRKKHMDMKKKLEEQVVQEFSHRCPYCGQPISYDEIELEGGENEIECPSCKKIYIYVKGVSADGGE
jgi:rubrerythrin